MLKRAVLASAVFFVCLGACVSQRAANSSDDKLIQSYGSPLPPGNMAAESIGDDLPDRVGGPY
jgi:hypothetical protein